MQLAISTVEAHFGDRPQLTVLDAGSEEGLLCFALARRHPSWRLLATDISLPPLRTGREWARAEGIRVVHFQADLQRPIGVGMYDAVVSLESLVEIPDDQAALRTLVAALRTGGVLIVQVPTADWVPVLKGAERMWRREVRHGYDADELTARLTQLGMTVESVTPTFRRAAALAQDLRDRLKHRGRWVRVALLPLMATAVALERAGATWGPARAVMVVAVRR